MTSALVPETPGAQDREYAHLLREFLFILAYKLERKLFLRFYEVAEQEYDIGFGPRNTWC